MHNMNCTLLALFLALTSCSDSTSTNQNVSANITNVWWKVRTFENIAGETITLAPNENYFVFFADSSIAREPDSVYGTFNLHGKTDSSCGNIYMASYKMDLWDSLNIGPIGTTKIYCGTNYNEYLQALGNAATFQLVDNRLIIFQNDKTKKLIFTK